MHASARRNDDASRRSPRVVVATRLYPPEVGAAAFRIHAAVRGLVEQGAAVDVVTAVPPGQPTEPTERGVRVRRARVLRDSSGAVRGFAQYLSFDLPLAWRLLRSRPDAFVAEAPPTTGLVTLIVSRLRRRPFFYYPGDVWTDGAASMGSPRLVVAALRAVERFVLRGARTVFAVSPEVARRLTELSGGTSRIVEVGNGVDTDVFSPDGPVAAPSRPFFVYAGTMSEWQRPEVFVEAFARLGRADIDLRFFGGGSAMDDVRAAGDRLAPGQVHLQGAVSPEEMARWLRGAVASLVSIVPGIGYDLARPTKTYASAAVGTPVLYAGAAAGAEVVRDGGLGEAVGFDAGEIADAMARLLEAAPADAPRRAARVAWVERNASLAVPGFRVAGVIGDVWSDRKAH